VELYSFFPFDFTLRMEDMFMVRLSVTYLLHWPLISSSIHLLPIPKGLDSNHALETGSLYYFPLLPTVRPEERWLSESNDAKTVSLRTISGFLKQTKSKLESLVQN